MDRAIIVFTRVPLPGKTKTRMMPALSGKECARLHTYFLQDICEACQACREDVYVNYTPEDEQKTGILRDIFGRDAEYFPQQGDTLGQRMYHAIEKVLEKGYKSCILIGTDVPELRAEHMIWAFDLLVEHDIVFGKTKDGGYYLIGMKKPWKEAFGLEQYGVSTVFEETLCRLRSLGVSIGYTAELQDMDTPADLQGYRDRMRADDFLKGSKTGKYLASNSRISIIVPVYNEEKTIEHLQDQLRGLKDKCEIILVDGGSTDNTLDKISNEFTLLHSPKSRAAQMNAGAKASHGDVLFFLHCDSELPAHPLAQIREVMRDYRAGCFGIAFHSRNFFMFTCRVISNHRVKDRKVMFGDQGIFVDRKLFFDAGMFPEMPIMEDYQFSLTLKEKGIRLGMTRKRIYTSDRRFPKGTIPKLKLMWKMNRMRKMYRDRIPVQTIAKLYKDIR